MSHDKVAAAATLRSSIVAARAETETERKLPEPIVDALVASELFRLSLPSDLDAPELDPLVALDIYEELAAAEASVAWLVWNSALPCLFSRFLAPSVRREIFGDRRWKYASSTRPTGRGVLRDGVYSLSGRWSLVSGCMHADWIGLMYFVEENGEVQMLGPNAPHMRMAFVPKGSYEILDTWHVGGLRGTGSHDVVVKDLQVPVERTFTPMDQNQLDRPIGRMPIACTMSAGHASMCLGIARAALDAVITLGRTKVTVDPVPGLRDRAANQFLVAEASTKIAALRAQLRNALGTLWNAAKSGSSLTPGLIADVWSAAVSAGRDSRALVTTMYEVAGTPSLYVDSSLERCHRDIHAAMQHVIIQRVWMEEAGRVKLGMDPTNPLFARRTDARPTKPCC
jgi:alkylation response protein AidB-like acyl-CoA dehydrogenase